MTARKQARTNRMQSTIGRWIGCLVVAASLASADPASAIAILHFEDSDIGTSAVPGALDLLGLTQFTTTATSVDDFATSLESGGPWNLVIFGEQANRIFPGSLATDLTAYVSDGGHVLGATWLSDSGFSALMQAQLVDRNTLSITTDTNPVFSGMGPTIGLLNPGWSVTWTQSWSPIDSAVAAGTLGKGGAVIVGNEGRTVLQGPLFDTFADISGGNRFVANEIQVLLCTPETCAAEGISCGTIPGCGDTFTCGTCTEDGNPCTVATCEAGTCQNLPGNPGVVCRPSAGECDVAEACTGASAECPADAFVPATTQCRPSAGVCDVAETCTGTSATCPADQFASATTVCRDAADACDRAETCTGSSASCPADELMPADTVCRAAQDACDEAEMCDGTTASCPPDARKPENASCEDNNPETGTSSCQGGQCVGVKATVVVPPPPPVAPTLPPSQVKIAVDVTVPDTSGTTVAKVTLQGTVDCDAVPPALQPRKCRQSGGTGATYGARLDTVTVRVTPLIKRKLGRSDSRSLSIGLSLTPLGRKLFAKLQPDEQSRVLSVDVHADVRDRQGQGITAVFPVLLQRHR